jgi:hypothetical protein
LDIARALGQAPFHATPTTVANWIEEQYSSTSGGGFNYDPAISATFDAFRGGHTFESATKYCLENGNPKGRKQNASAIRAIMPYALSHPSICYRIGLTAVAIGRYSGRTVYAKIKAPMVRVEGQSAFLVMPGYRMSFRPSDIAIDLACSIALETCAQGDLSVADFEYLYAGPGPDTKGRMFQAIQGKDRHRYSREQINRLLEIFVAGVEQASRLGLDQKAPNLNGYRIIDPNAPGLF